MINECLIIGQESIDRSELNLSIHIADVLPSLVADRTRIKQIILNVLSKSSKFTLKGGSSEVRATINVLGQRKIVVKNTDFGIAEEDILLVFQPFGQARENFANTYEGTYLGLLAVNHLTEMHQVRIELKSLLNQGTCVTLCFPESLIESVLKA